ncbi:DUF4214 domain-containing protein [Pseudomonas sp. Pseusp122]|uniref:DUF4214 domain-containing protein n=1 Tax=unclassified Pseudomonas TaxID=196821 RepID=UPI0039A4D32A
MFSTRSGHREMAASDYIDQVQKLYIAYFGRPADPTGLNYWTSQVNAAGGNMVVAIAGFCLALSICRR